MGNRRFGLIFIRLVAVIMLLWALTDNPYGYYILLRWVVCSTFVYCAIGAYRTGNESWAWIFGVIASVYNPIFPLHLGRPIWSLVNVVSVVLIIVSLFRLKEKSYGTL